MSKRIVITGSILILLSIILGAMAAHALEKVVSQDLITTFEKGVKYQFYTGIGLLAVGLNSDKINFSLSAFYFLNVIGVLLFSVSIYLYTLHEMIPSFRPMAMIVPFGGLSFISAWIVLTIQLIRQK